MTACRVTIALLNKTRTVELCFVERSPMGHEAGQFIGPFEKNFGNGQRFEFTPSLAQCFGCGLVLPVRMLDQHERFLPFGTKVLWQPMRRCEGGQLLFKCCPVLEPSAMPVARIDSDHARSFAKTTQL